MLTIMYIIEEKCMQVDWRDLSHQIYLFWLIYLYCKWKACYFLLVFSYVLPTLHLIDLNVNSWWKKWYRRISDINGPSQDFPILSNMTGMIRLYVVFLLKVIWHILFAIIWFKVIQAFQFRILRNCNITGEIPSYFWTMKNLDML